MLYRSRLCAESVHESHEDAHAEDGEDNEPDHHQRAHEATATMTHARPTARWYSVSSPQF